MAAKADILRDLMARHFGSGYKPTALDVGCGIGAFHPFARGMFGRLCGTDISAASIAQARQNHPDVEYEAYDGNILPYGDGTFDLAVTICVLHHVPPVRWLGFLREIRRVVRPGGLSSTAMRRCCGRAKRGGCSRMPDCARSLRGISCCCRGRRRSCGALSTACASCRSVRNTSPAALPDALPR
jgi:ubiquinone/menaquinone biosynthesis C-methylase UbiE